jgi:hypothetical protein
MPLNLLLLGDEGVWAGLQSNSLGSYLRQRDILVVGAQGRSARNLNVEAARVRTAFPQNRVWLSCGARRVQELCEGGIKEGFPRILVDWEPSTMPPEWPWTWQWKTNVSRISSTMTILRAHNIATGLLPTTVPMNRYPSWDYGLLTELSDWCVPMTQNKARSSDMDATLKLLRRQVLSRPGLTLDQVGVMFAMGENEAGVRYPASITPERAALQTTRTLQSEIENVYIFGKDISRIAEYLLLVRRERDGAD